MAAESTLVEFPSKLIEEIDSLAGSGMHKSLLLEFAQKKVTSLRQLHALQAATGIWKDSDHPELAEGSDAFIRNIREDRSSLDPLEINR